MDNLRWKLVTVVVVREMQPVEVADELLPGHRLGGRGDQRRGESAASGLTINEATTRSRWESPAHCPGGCSTGFSRRDIGGEESCTVAG